MHQTARLAAALPLLLGARCGATDDCTSLAALSLESADNLQVVEYVDQTTDDAPVLMVSVVDPDSSETSTGELPLDGSEADGFFAPLVDVASPGLHCSDAHRLSLEFSMELPASWDPALTDDLPPMQFVESISGPDQLSFELWSGLTLIGSPVFEQKRY